MTREELNRQYSEAAVQLGNLEYTNFVLSEEIEKNVMKMDKLKRNMQNLSRSAAAKTEVELPEVADEQA